MVYTQTKQKAKQKRDREGFFLNRRIEKKNRALHHSVNKHNNNNRYCEDTDILTTKREKNKMREKKQTQQKKRGKIGRAHV